MSEPSNRADVDEAAGELLMRDVSRAGHELGRRHLTGLPARLAVRDLLAHRVEADTREYNDDVTGSHADAGIYRGLVQPADSIRHSDGFRMRRPRSLDPAPLTAAAWDAVVAGLLAFRVGSRVLTDLDEIVEVDAHEEIVAVLERSVVARDG